MTTPAETLGRPCRTQEQVAIARLRRELRRLLSDVEPDCGQPDCPDCRPWRPARAALLDTQHLDAGGGGEG